MAYDLQLETEAALATGAALQGISLDIERCFDTIPQHVVLEIGRIVGLPADFLATWKHTLPRHQRHMSIAGATHPTPVRPKRGLAQGDPLSPLGLALLSLLWRAMLCAHVVANTRAEAVTLAGPLGHLPPDHQGQLLYLRSYADDWLIVARHGLMPWKAVADLSTSFEQATGVRFQAEKSWRFALNAPPGVCQLGERQVPVVSHAKTWGLCCTSPAELRSVSDRPECRRRRRSLRGWPFCPCPPPKKRTWSGPPPGNSAFTAANSRPCPWAF